MIIFATGNQGKLKEVREILEQPVISMKDAGISLEIIEDGKTFEENAIIKVKAIGQFIKDAYENFENNSDAEGSQNFLEDYEEFRQFIKTSQDLRKAIILSDDSGLCVDYLNGEPGVLSARYMGEDTSYEVKNKKIIELLKDAPKVERTARFVAAIAALLPSGEILTARGEIEGTIAYEPKGENGFGYDPIFYVEEYGVTTAEMPMDLKNSISHRGRGLRQMRALLDEKN